MGRWIYAWDPIRSWSIYVGKNNFVSIDTIEESTVSGINTLELLHNADCAAYENQIADLEEERDAAVEFAHTVERQFAAATATLERLREVVPRDCIICDGTHEGRWMLSVWRILYPQPQPQREAIRQIAERHGFEPMPPQLGQASVDGETTFAAVPQPPEHTL